MLHRSSEYQASLSGVITIKKNILIALGSIGNQNNKSSSKSISYIRQSLKKLRNKDYDRGSLYSSWLHIFSNHSLTKERVFFILREIRNSINQDAKQYYNAQHYAKEYLKLVFLLITFLFLLNSHQSYSRYFFLHMPRRIKPNNEEVVVKKPLGLETGVKEIVISLSLFIGLSLDREKQFHNYLNGKINELINGKTHEVTPCSFYSYEQNMTLHCLKKLSSSYTKIFSVLNKKINHALCYNNACFDSSGFNELTEDLYVNLDELTQQFISKKHKIDLSEQLLVSMNSTFNKELGDLQAHSLARQSNTKAMMNSSQQFLETQQQQKSIMAYLNNQLQEYQDSNRMLKKSHDELSQLFIMVNNERNMIMSIMKELKKNQFHAKLIALNSTIEKSDVSITVNTQANLAQDTHRLSKNISAIMMELGTLMTGSGKVIDKINDYLKKIEKINHSIDSSQTHLITHVSHMIQEQLQTIDHVNSLQNHASNISNNNQLSADSISQLMVINEALQTVVNDYQQERQQSATLSSNISCTYSNKTIEPAESESL